MRRPPIAWQRTGRAPFEARVVRLFAGLRGRSAVFGLAVGLSFLSGCASLFGSHHPPPPPPPAPAPMPPPPPAPAKKVIVLRSVSFDSNRAAVPAQQVPILKEAARTLEDVPGAAVSLVGHADAREAHPKTLSKRRAEAVRDGLVSLGVSRKRIHVEGVGATQPLATDETAAGRAENRRVELRVVD